MSLKHVALDFTCSLVLMCAAASSAASQKVTFSAPAGEFGVWVPPNAGDERLVELDNPPAANPFAIESNPLLRTPRFVTTGTATSSLRKPTASQVPFQPWAESLYAYRQENQ